MMKCQTPYCRNETRGGRKLCPKCQSRKWRMEHPVEATYLNLKHNAKRRGKVFDLTLEEFTAFVTPTRYMQKKGIFKDSLHLDRKDETKGYIKENLQVLKNCQNVRKYLVWSYDRQGKPVDFNTTTYKAQPAVAGVPF